MIHFLLCRLVCICQLAFLIIQVLLHLLPRIRCIRPFSSFRLCLYRQSTLIKRATVAILSNRIGNGLLICCRLNRIKHFLVPFLLLGGWPGDNSLACVVNGAKIAVQLAAVLRYIVILLLEGCRTRFFPIFASGPCSFSGFKVPLFRGTTLARGGQLSGAVLDYVGHLEACEGHRGHSYRRFDQLLLSYTATATRVHPLSPFCRLAWSATRHAQAP